MKITRLDPDISSAVDCPSNTTVGNLNVVAQVGIFEVVVDGQNLDIGTVIKAKCTITEFRGNKQLDLKRISIMRTTDEEAQAWADTAAFRQNVLAKPWVLSPKELKRIEKGLKVQRKKEKEHQRLKAEHEARKWARRRVRDRKIAEWGQKAEKKRRKEEFIMNHGALI